MRIFEGLVCDLDFGSFYHVDMFVDILFNQFLFFHLLSFCYLLMIFFFVFQHVGFIPYTVFFQKFHEFPSIVFLYFQFIAFEQDKLSIDDGGLVIDFIKMLVGCFVCFGFAAEDGFFFFLGDWLFVG